jgi:DNA-binding GntR family transcriptional regulator
VENNDLARKAELGEILHQFIRQNCRNKLIISALELIKIQNTRVWRGAFAISGRMNKAFEGHKKILKALKDRDEEAAEQIMKKHIAEAFREYLEAIMEN